MSKADTWNSLGAIVSRVAARLARDEEIQKDAASTPEGDTGGASKPSGGDSGAVRIAPTAQGRNAVGACQRISGGRARQISGRKARADFDNVIQFVGISPTPGRAIADAPRTKLGRASIS